MHGPINVRYILHIVIREDRLPRHIPEDGDVHSQLIHVFLNLLIV